MLALIFLIPLQVATARFLISQPVLKVMYGSIGVLDDLKIPPNASRRADVDADITYGDHEALPDFQDFMDEVADMEQWTIDLNSTSHDPDIKDFSDASKILGDLKKDLEAVAKEPNEETRRHLELDLPSELKWIWRNDVRTREWYYPKLCLTYLIHIRFQVDTGIRKKMATQNLKGYKMGYLFHRLMRAKTQMYRIMEEWDSMRTLRLSQNRPNWRTKTHGLKLLLQLYERMLQLDVDVKDTVDMIKQLYWGRQMFQKEIATDATKHLWR